MKVPRCWFPKAGHRGPQALDSDNPAREPEARVDLLMMANHDNRNGLERGCCDPSLGFLADRWNWDRSKVRRFLQRLERGSFITRENRKGRRQTVTRFLAYGPPQEADTLATHSRGRSRHNGSQVPQPVQGRPRHSPPVPTNTVRDPNRTKRVGSARKEEVSEKKACSCGRNVEIDADEEACSTCRREAEYSAWTKELLPVGEPA